jgi:hypothetical protein
MSQWHFSSAAEGHEPLCFRYNQWPVASDIAFEQTDHDQP